MQNLRNALGRDDEGDQGSISRMGPSRMYNKSKSAAIWALDPDEAEGDLKEQPKTETKLKGSIQAPLLTAFKKDPIFSEMSFYEVLQQIQSQNATAAELQCLTAIESVAREMQSRTDKALYEFLAAFVECLIRRIKKLRRKEKKHELQEYDKIVQNNFKKKGAVQFIDEDHPENKGYLQSKEEQLARRKPVGSKDRTGSQNEGSSKKNGSSSSTEGKLGKLLSNSKLKDEKKEVVSSSEQPEAHEESVSFSAIVSQSVTVRQRRPKESGKKEKEKEESGKQKGKKQGDQDQEDEAFIFYRPKAGKKK